MAALKAKVLLIVVVSGSFLVSASDAQAQEWQDYGKMPCSIYLQIQPGAVHHNPVDDLNSLTYINHDFHWTNPEWPDPDAGPVNNYTVQTEMMGVQAWCRKHPTNVLDQAVLGFDAQHGHQ